jgi:hypothetical protein
MILFRDPVLDRLIRPGKQAQGPSGTGDDGNAVRTSTIPLPGS